MYQQDGIPKHLTRSANHAATLHVRTTFLFRRTEEDSWSFTAKQCGSPLRLRKLLSAVSNPCLGNVQPSCDCEEAQAGPYGKLGSLDYISKKVADGGRGMKFSILS